MKKIILLFLLLILSIRAYGESNVSEDSVKAAYIFHFINFTQWEENMNQYNICVPDDENLKKALETTMKGKLINNKPVHVSYNAPVCHVLVSDAFVNAQDILTIGSLDKGAMFEFQVVNNKLKFLADLEKIQQCKLKISSQLLKLALLRKPS